MDIDELIMRLLTSPTSAPRLAIKGLKEGKKKADEAVRKATKPAREAITREAEEMADEGDVMRATALQSMSDLLIPEDALGAALTAVPAAGAAAKMAPKAAAAMKMRRGMARIPFEPKGPRGPRMRVVGDELEEPISMVLGKDEGKKAFEDIMDRLKDGTPQAPGFKNDIFFDEQLELVNILDEAGRQLLRDRYARNARAFNRQNEKAKKIREAVSKNRDKQQRIQESGMRGPTVDEEMNKLRTEFEDLNEQMEQLARFELRLRDELNRLRRMDTRSDLDGLLEGVEHHDMILRLQGRSAPKGDPRFANMNEVIEILSDNTGRSANEVRKAFLDYLGAME